MEKPNGTEKLDLLKIKSEKVIVGELELVLKTSTLMQQKALVVALGKIDPKAVFAAAGPIISTAGGSDFMAALVEHGPEVLHKIMEFLAVAAGDALAEAASAVLDNEANFRTLRDDEKVVDDNDRTTDGKRYIQSDKLRAWVESTITPAQAFHVLSTAVVLNDYGRLGGVLTGLVTRAAGAVQGVSPTGNGTPVRASKASSGAQS